MTPYGKFADDGFWLLDGAAGEIDCKRGGDPYYPIGKKGHVYRITAPGRIGGPFGKEVEKDDWIIALEDNPGGAEHHVGASWMVLAGGYDSWSDPH